MKLFYYNDDTIIECGLDEAGRGPLIGNVYAACVIWDKDLIPPNNLIIDSKKLTPKKRKLAFEWIIKNIKHYGIGYSTSTEIDDINILQATKLAMERAIDNLTDIKPTHFIIDGTGWEKQMPHINVKSIVKGDSKYYSIAAASILAKEFHDEHIRNLCINNDLNEKYDILKNMGYGTKKHIEGIHKYGSCEYHRKSFKIKKIEINIY